MFTNSTEGCSIKMPIAKRFRALTMMNTSAISVWMLGLAIVSPVTAQQNGSSNGVFQASVVDLSAQSEPITVPLRRSVTVETNVEINRAEIIAREIADVQIINPKRILITGQSYGTTSVILFGKDDHQHIFEVTVELDLERLRETLRAIDPQSTVEASSVQGHIVLTGTVSGVDQVERMTEVAQLFLPPSAGGTSTTTVQNHLRVAGEQQVLLRCVVAEVSRSAVRELGVNGFLAGDDFRDAFVVNQLGGINPINLGAAADAPVNGTIPFLTGTDGVPIGDATSLSLGFPRIQMQLFIKALADNSLLSILAEPNLVAVSGETASFLAGGEFPIPVPQGNQQVTIEFREFGVRLNFTPVVLGQHLIRMRINPEVSELDFSTTVQIEGFAVPGLTTRAAETTVEVGTGQTLAIAGLLNEQVRGLASRVPGIGDVPILGTLFRSIRYQKSMTELVILVTPEIVAPLDAHQAARIPSADTQSPSDFELYALGLLDGGEKVVDLNMSVSGENNNRSAQRLQTQPDELSVHGPWGHARWVDFRW